MDSFCADLGVNPSHIHETRTKDLYYVLVHKSWLKSLSKNGKLTKFKNCPLLDTDDDTDWWVDPKYSTKEFCKIYVSSLKKYNFKVFPLPRNRSGNDATLTYPQLMHYVALTNYKNIWKSAFNKFPNSYSINNLPHNHSSTPSKGLSAVVTYDELLREVIRRMHNCRIVHYKLDYIYAPIPDSREANAMDTKSGVENLYPALCAIETSSHYYLVYDNCLEYTLLDCVTHSPAMLEESYNKTLFLVYQLLSLVKNLHEMGLLLGEISLNDIYLRENLFLQVVPNFKANVFQFKAEDQQQQQEQSDSNNSPPPSHLRSGHPASIPRSLLNSSPSSLSLRDSCRLWCSGQLSNFDYLTVLNNAVGRRMDVPEYHHIMPWVSDLEQRNGQNWRDFHKSKFRINKGDPQLELTYQQATSSSSSSSSPSSSTVPHHVTDVLSEITYYVYKARRTPKKLLCKQVRPNWVPAEYPVSIQRLQEWTPDESIPEFYSDPMIFKSIHEDLPDLEVPKWATCPEDFIQKHREALESQHVSERLHLWIDLNYGYKLSGSAAVKAKNVCLSLVDEHRNLCRRGLVQLFSHPHPTKILSNGGGGALDRVPPRISAKLLERGRSTENVFQLVDPMERMMNEGGGGGSATAGNMERSSSFYTNVLPQRTIKLPVDYNPIAHLNAVEEMEIFLNRTFNVKEEKAQKETEKSHLDKKSLQDPLADLSGFTNRLFEEHPGQQQGGSSRELFTLANSTNFKQTASQARVRELQIVGCLILELFLVNKMRPALLAETAHSPSSSSFEQRLRNCLEVFGRERGNLPKCIEYPLSVLLQLGGENNEVVTARGLPPPSAHQLVQPLLNNTLFPFPHEYILLQSVLGTIYRFDRLVQFLDLYAFEGSHRTESARVAIQRKMVRCKINLCVAQMEGLLSARGYEQFDSFEIILPFFVDMVNSEDSSAMAAWHLFDIVAAALGVERTKQFLLGPILNLYESRRGEEKGTGAGVQMASKSTGSRRIGKVSKETRLYHHWFLIRLIVRFGLRVFLENFITPLVEAVGGIKDECLLMVEEKQKQQQQQQNRQSVKEVGESEDEMQKKIEEEIFNLEIVEDEIKLKIPETNLTPVVKSVLKRKVDKSKPGQSKSEVSYFSLIWLSHRLGPVLTARFVTRKLLKMLTLCYVGEENLLPELDKRESVNVLRLSTFTLTSSRVVGDQKALSVLDCLTSISVLFGDQFILVQYFPHLSELVALCKKKIVASLEGALISGLELIKHLVPYLSDTILMEQLQGVFLQNFIHPIIRILATAPMPGGYLARSVLARKLIDTIYVLAVRIGREMTKEHLCVPAMERFFTIFDRAQDDAGSIQSAGSEGDSEVDHRLQIWEEIQSVFTPELAYSCYVPFLSYLGESVMQSTLKNFPLILVLCQEYEKPPGKEDERLKEVESEVAEDVSLPRGHSRTPSRDIAKELLSAAMETSMTECSNSFGSQVIGNRIEMRTETGKTVSEPKVAVNDVLGLVTYKAERINTARHLRGNWLAYWEHENCRRDKDESGFFDVKQIKLQTFTGHVSAVKSLLVLDNENSFMSASRDKTVKLWSLKSEEGGTRMCQWTYGSHKKSVHSLAFLESMRLAVSCDSTVHVWDPFVGSPVGQLEKYAGVSVIRTCPTPSALVMAGTMDSTVKMIDARCMAYVNDWKLTNMANGPVRSIALAPSGNWMSVGLSSGQLYNLDTRMGMILSSWRPSEGELLQVAVPSEEQIITSTLDHNISVWSVADGVQQFEFQGLSEPCHCLCLNGSELLAATPANKICVYSAVRSDAEYSTTRLRQDTLKGVLTSMAVLPLNRLLLLASDAGQISLVC